MYIKRTSSLYVYVEEMGQTDRQSPRPRNDAVLLPLADLRFNTY